MKGFNNSFDRENLCEVKECDISHIGEDIVCSRFYKIKTWRNTKVKKLLKRITEIDDQLSDKKELEKEFVRRNKNGTELFSINTLVLILEKEKEKLIEEIDILTEKMNPKLFNERQSKLDAKIYLLKEVLA